jgi:hypothetical protein
MHFFKTRVQLDQVGRREVVPLWEYDTEASTSQSQLAYNSLPTAEPVFSSLLVTEPLTDVLDDGFAIGGAGFLVNQRLRALLATFSLGPHQFYPLEAFSYASRKPLATSYFWLQLVALDFYTFIDYAQSAFVLVDDLAEHTLAELTLESPAELRAAMELTWEEDRSIRYTKLAFKASDDAKHLDIICLNDLSDTEFTYPLFSERLKRELEAQAIIGFEFKRAPFTWTRA